MTHIDKYFTSNLALASAISLYFPILFLNRDNPRKVVFEFNGGSDLLGLVDKYWQGTLAVEPQAYFNQLKTIKSRLYAES